MAARPARADQVYFTPRDLLADFFRSSKNVTYKKVQIDDSEKRALSTASATRRRRPSYTFYVATSGGRVDGYAFIDEEKGEHLPITFAVKLSPAGQGDAPGDRRLSRGARRRGARRALPRAVRRQVGARPIETEQDIVAVSGATISSRAMAVGVKRAVVLFDELVKPTALDAATASR